MSTPLDQGVELETALQKGEPLANIERKLTLFIVQALMRLLLDAGHR